MDRILEELERGEHDSNIFYEMFLDKTKFKNILDYYSHLFIILIRPFGL